MTKRRHKRNQRGYLHPSLKNMQEWEPKRDGWISKYCDLHDGPFDGRAYRLSDGRTCCGTCFCASDLFQPHFILRKLTGEPTNRVP